jgi:hypothetical protein
MEFLKLLWKCVYDSEGGYGERGQLVREGAGGKEDGGG